VVNTSSSRILYETRQGFIAREHNDQWRFDIQPQKSNCGESNRSRNSEKFFQQGVG